MACAVLRHGIIFFWCLWPKSTPIFWFNVYFSFLSKPCQFWAQVKRKPVCSTSTPACFMCAWDERGLTLWRTCGGERSAFETFYCVGLGNRTWIIRFGSRCLYISTHSQALCFDWGKVESWVQVTHFCLFFSFKWTLMKHYCTEGQEWSFWHKFFEKYQ